MLWINARRRRVSIFLAQLLLMNNFAAWSVPRASSGHKILAWFLSGLSIKPAHCRAMAQGLHPVAGGRHTGETEESHTSHPDRDQRVP